MEVEFMKMAALMDAGLMKLFSLLNRSWVVEQ